MPEGKVSRILKRIGKLVRGRGEAEVSRERWLPEGYEMRKGQIRFIEEASKAIKSNEIFFGNAPCGIGKSLASLLAIVPQLEENKLVITFRTRNQLHIFLKELKVLGQNMPTVSLFSKKSMCPMQRKGNLAYTDFFEECKKLRDNCKSLTKPYCRFYLKNAQKQKEVEQLALECARRNLDPLASMRLFSKQGYCTYEALKKILSMTQIFLGTYHYAFDPQIRGILLREFGVDFGRVYLIVDEAHNIPAFARELLSDQLTRVSVERALKETQRFKHELRPLVKGYLRLLDDKIFQQAHRTMKKQGLQLLNPQKVSELFQNHSGVSGTEAAEILIDYGEVVKQKRQELGYERLLSYNHRVGEFLENFFQKEGEKYIHLARKDWQNGIILEVRCFDGREITDNVLRRVKGGILMSGSLSPPAVYRDLMLYDNLGVHLEEFDSPFPAENRLILVASDVSSMYKKRTVKMLERWREYVNAISQANEGNVAFFFTSYELMHAVLALLKTSRNEIVEKRKSKRSSVVRQLSKSPDNALFGVMRGKFSEGIDYPNNILTCVVAMGLPYATWNIYQKALMNYYDYQFPGKGEIYAYLSPAILRLVQTSGRVHRSPQDKGCIIILDERLTHPHIRQQLPSYFQKEMKIVEGPKDCARNISEFWNFARGRA